MGFWNSIADKLDDMVNNWTMSQVESALDDIEKFMGQLETKTQIREYNKQYLRDVMALKSVHVEVKTETDEQINDIQNEKETENESITAKLIKKMKNDAVELVEIVTSHKSIALNTATATRLLLKADDEDLLCLLRNSGSFGLGDLSFKQKFSKHTILSVLNETYPSKQSNASLLKQVTSDAAKKVPIYETYEDKKQREKAEKKRNFFENMLHKAKDGIYRTWHFQEAFSANNALQFRYGTLNQTSQESIIFEFLGKPEAEKEDNQYLDSLYNIIGVNAARQTRLADKLTQQSQYDLGAANQYLAFSNTRTNLLLEMLNRQRDTINEDFKEFARIAHELVKKMGEHDIQSLTVNLPDSQFKRNLIRSSGEQLMDEWLRGAAVTVCSIIPFASNFYSKYAAEALEKANQIRSDTGMALDKIGEIIVSLCKTNRYVINTIAETTRLYEVFQSYFDELKNMNQFIENGGDMDDIEEETLLVISNGYQLSAILTDIVCTPVFKTQEEGTELPEINQEALENVLATSAQIPSLSQI
ncbi:MAG: hypothetical protein ACTTIX_08970 [Peptoanaerobacter stomatis]